MTAVILDFHSRRHVEMELATETYLRARLAAALGENATLVETTRSLADEVRTLRAENATLRSALAVAEPCARWLRFWGIG